MPFAQRSCFASVQRDLRVPDVRQLSPAAATPIGVSARLWMAVLALLVVGGVVLAPLLLDTYMVNILIRAFFVAIAAVTVDIMWGYCGTLTFGQSAFFGIGVYALAIVFTEFGFGSWQILFAVGAAIIISGAVAALTGWLSFYPGSTPLYASIVSLVVPIVLVQILYSGGTFTGSSSGLVGFETFDLSFENWFRLAGLGLASVAVVALVLMRSDTGRLLEALRDNDERCSLSRHQHVALSHHRPGADRHRRGPCRLRLCRFRRSGRPGECQFHVRNQVNRHGRARAVAAPSSVPSSER